MTNHYDEMRVAPDPSQAEALRQRLHARLARGSRIDDQDVVRSIPSADTDPDHPDGGTIMLETEDRPTGDEPRTPPRSSGRWLRVAAAAAVIAIVGTLLVVAAGDDDDPVDTSKSPTTAAPPAPAQDIAKVEGASEGFVRLEPGLYFTDPDLDPTTPLRVTYEVKGEGWETWFGAVKPTSFGFTMLTITEMTNLVSDGCLDHTPLDPSVGPTVDDLATALTQLAPFEVTAPPTDVTAFGYQGKHLALTVPDLPMTASADGAKFADCVDGKLHSWFAPANDNGTTSFSGYDGPGQTEEFWILDVEGTRLVIAKLDDERRPADIAERDAIFDSIRIEP